MILKTMEKLITYFGQIAKVNCDENCKKAWGVNRRPKIQISDDEDDYAYLCDSELGYAPVNPGTYEGGQAKPTDKSQIPNKWCVRECERCNISPPGKFNEPLKIKSFSERVYNIQNP